MLLAPLPTTRSERTAYWSRTMSCSAPSPLIRLICTVSPSCTLERGIDFTVDVAADAQKNHPALGDAGTQRENGWGMHVAMGRDAGRGSGASRGRRRRLRLQVQRCRLGRWRRMLVLLGPDRRWETNQACGKDRPAEHLHGNNPFSSIPVELELGCSAGHHASNRPSAARLRSTMRRELGSPIVASFSSWVMVRDTVSIVSPR